MHYTFSIIIPHRGTPELLQRLLNSIPQREDMEVIVVEDSDGCGAGWARNQGLRRAKGDYLIFADSDDYFLSGFDSFLDEVKKDIHNVATADWDVAYFSATSIEEGTNKPSWRAARVNWMMAQEASLRSFLLRHTFTEPWCHIVKRSLVEQHNITFDETPILNDVHFSTRVGYHARRISVFNDKVYCVTNRPDSVGKRKSTSRYIAYSKVMAETNQFNRTHCINQYHARMMRPFAECALKLKWKTALYCWQTIHNAGFSHIEIIGKLAKYPFHVIHWWKRKSKYTPYTEQ